MYFAHFAGELLAYSVCVSVIEPNYAEKIPGEHGHCKTKTRYSILVAALFIRQHCMDKFTSVAAYKDKGKGKTSERR